MKAFLLSLVTLACTSASAIPFEEFAIDALANDPASDFILDTANKAKAILQLKSESDRVAGMCALFKQRIGKGEIGMEWLGQYANLAREKTAVNQFINMVPSIIMTKAVDAVGGDGTLSGSFVVNPKATSRGNNMYGVRVTVTEAKGKSYNGTAVVYNGPNGWKIVDGEYMGFSAVGYQGRDYQKFLRAEYNKNPSTSMPVSALVNKIKSEGGYVNCN